jgi:hypothetical protein
LQHDEEHDFLNDFFVPFLVDDDGYSVAGVSTVNHRFSEPRSGEDFNPGISW